jgi:nitrite reductase (NADH) large subunit
MVGQRLLEALADRGATEQWRVVVFGEEPRPAYDRVALTSFFAGRSAEDLTMVEPGFFERAGIELRLSDPVLAIDLAGRMVTSASGDLNYERLVLATGSYPFVPPIPGADAKGCFVYRTIEDLEAIKSYADGARVGAVVGGGLLGLEAAGALQSLGLQTHVVEFAPRLMPIQVDEAGGLALRRRIEAQGVVVHTDARTSSVDIVDGRAAQMVFADAEPLDVDLVVFSAGIRPRDQLARECGLAVGERGGIVVDSSCTTSDPAVSAIGECAAVDGRVYGLVGPGYTMAEVVADRICGGTATFDGADMSTKLKLLGIDVASFGDAQGVAEGAQEVTYVDAVENVYRKLVVAADGQTLLGGVLVGDASSYEIMRAICVTGGVLPGKPAELLVPSTGAGLLGAGALADNALICSCNSVTKHGLCEAIAEGAQDVPALKKCTKAGTGCGSCVPLMTQLIKSELTKAGVEVSNALCEHFAYSRQELFDIVRVKGITSFEALLRGHGTGRGCEVCKPVAASILASLGSGHILDGEQAALQDTNDHFLANLQRDGTYSVVPRVPGGEITAEKLIVIGEVARDFGLYTKITGGQRIDLFGARVEQLPAIWRRLVDAGFESGHAYGKALRTVKSCVGQTWCRFGVQDSTTLAIDLELRYRGLRAPHKIKMAVSGCARECAEAQSKDVGVIATEKGWNLYVGGNGGMTPAHAKLLATDIDTETLVRYIDRFLMFYVRTADRLERTAPWLVRHEGGIDYIRSVVVDDSLGLAADLEADMARHVAGYRDEWADTLADEERLKRFVTFVNAPDEPDPNVVFVVERGQIRPAQPDELLAAASVE